LGKSPDPGAAESGAVRAREAPIDPDLAVVVEAWPGLPEATRRAVREGCRFDLRAAERVRTFFRKFLRHSKGQWAGKPFELLDWQWREVVAPLFG
jgi:hypothetical protein